MSDRTGLFLRVPRVLRGGEFGAVFAVVVLTLALGAAAVQLQAVRERTYPSTDTGDEALSLRSGGAIRLLTGAYTALAADAATGKVLWEFSANFLWKSSPMTYVFDNKQYVALPIGQSIVAFGLAE
jgi:hypothetical protein